MTDSATKRATTSHRTTAGSHPGGPERPGRRERLRAGVARRIVRVRQDARRYRRLSAILTVVAALSLTLAGVSLAADDDSEAVPLGRGVASVEEVDPGAPSGEDLVDVPERPAPPTPEEAAESLGEGSASYYHDTLEGRSTASGEPYRGAALSAAHRSLPFGSKVRVTSLANGRSVVVRINDRGPFAAGRVIDLSRSAASRIGLLERGHGRVRLELLK